MALDAWFGHCSSSPSFIGGLFLPESPRFLVRHDNEAGAREILGMINDDPNSIEAEISDIQLMAKEENKVAYKKYLVKCHVQF